MSVNMIAASLRCSVPSLIASPETLQTSFVPPARWVWLPDRKSTRLNSSHSQISYAVFCLKKKNNFFRADGQTARLHSRHSQSAGVILRVIQRLEAFHFPHDGLVERDGRLAARHTLHIVGR